MEIDGMQEQVIAIYNRFMALLVISNNEVLKSVGDEKMMKMSFMQDLSNCQNDHRNSNGKPYLYSCCPAQAYHVLAWNNWEA